MILMRLNPEMLEFDIGNLDVVERMQELPTDEPFAGERIAFLNGVSKKLLSNTKAKDYSDVITFAYWIRKANMERKKQEFLSDGRMRMGKGVVFHIAPSNVAVNYAYSFAVGFVMGNANIVRLPSKEFLQVIMINQAIKEVLEKEERFQKWKNYIVLLRYKKNKAVNDYFSSICDVRVIWGGDAAIQNIRQSGQAPRAREITFADRYSICIIDAGTYMESTDKNKIALNFYNDTYLTDQNACTSPKLVCWIGKEETVCSAKGIFWKNMWELVQREYSFQPIQFVNKFVCSCIAATKIEDIRMVPMQDNLITRMELKKLELKIQEYSGNSGLFYEYHLKDVFELISLCNEKMQTVSFLGDISILLPIIRSGVKGIDRITCIGQTMEFDFIWDGYNLVDYMTRTISLSGI